jgi:uncharacterized protein
MPVQATYPGVYLQEIPSGVKTIVGVSTSVTAFVGTAKRGPIDKAVSVFNFSEFETQFGGLDADSEMSYGVRQFFINGGTHAVIVRVAKNATPASKYLQDKNSKDSLTITAINAGSAGNNIEVRVDYNTITPDSTFNLTIKYTSPDNPADARIETFKNLSMNSKHPRYVEDVVNGISEIINVKRDADVSTLSSGTASSGIIGDVKSTLDTLDDRHNTFRVAVNGTAPVTVRLNLSDDIANLGALCAAIASAVTNQANGIKALTEFTCKQNTEGNSIVMTSVEAGENSRVEVLPGLSNDASTRLMLTIASGGSQVDAAAQIRPAETPDRATLTSGDLLGIDFPNLQGSFHVSLDGQVPQPVTISGCSNITELAKQIQEKIRALKPGMLSYREFICVANSDILVLSTGSRGAGASIVISEAGGTMAGSLKLLVTDGAVSTFPVNNMLKDGVEEPITALDAYQSYIGSREGRKGIYALEDIDIFNLLCLPGLSDPGILADCEAYCRERRAFMLVDTAETINTTAAMAAAISGTDFPKSDHAAVYFPWIKIADPLKGGKLRNSAPSGTLAGVYARTDANRGVWKAPAGTEAGLLGVQALRDTLTDAENGLLNPLGANCLRIFPVYGAVSWGARTLNGADQAVSEYQYIPVRRLALFIEESLYRGTQWVVFEPNDEPLWAQIRLNLGSFMHDLFRQGAFQGITPREAYLVKCDKETTTQSDINKGIVNILVGFAPLKPAEFVFIKIQQLAGQIQS